MRLDRNIPASKGRGKYALIKNRVLDGFAVNGELPPAIEGAIKVLESAGILDWGLTPETEFFAIRLKDRFACATLHEYAHSARMGGMHDYARDVEELSARSGVHHPNCKTPD